MASDLSQLCPIEQFTEIIYYYEELNVNESRRLWGYITLNTRKLVMVIDKHTILYIVKKRRK